MFSMNRETMTMAAIFVALAVCFYLFNENKKTKAELASFKTIVNKPAPSHPPVKSAVKKVEFVEPEPESEE
jgi:preprotein translocase subunit SecG